jgi:hypothetical protein
LAVSGELAVAEARGGISNDWIEYRVADMGAGPARMARGAPKQLQVKAVRRNVVAV